MLTVRTATRDAARRSDWRRPAAPRRHCPQWARAWCRGTTRDQRSSEWRILQSWTPHNVGPAPHVRRRTVLATAVAARASARTANNDALAPTHHPLQTPI